jgi:DNA processing protein
MRDSADIAKARPSYPIFCVEFSGPDVCPSGVMIHAVSCPSPTRSRSSLLYVQTAQVARPVPPSCTVAIVGARRPSHGTAVAFAFAAEAANSGFAVVSGLALGCDTAAHRGCLEANGITIAVLPCGLDRVVPVSNSNLAHNILSASGFLASEYPPGTEVRNFRFVQRNRVIATLSQAVIVVEAETRSGTLHTARFAREQNKPLACYIPKSGKASPGCLHLVKHHNATPLRNPDELKSFLETLPRKPKRRGGGGWHA